MLVIGKDEYVLGAASTGDGGIVVAGLPLPAGLSATVQDIRSGRPGLPDPLPRAQPDPQHLPAAAVSLDHPGLFRQQLAGALSLQAGDQAGGGVGGCHGRRGRRPLCSPGQGGGYRGIGRAGAVVQSHGGGSGREPRPGGNLHHPAFGCEPGARRAPQRTGNSPGDDSQRVVTLDPQMRVLQANRASRNLLSPREHHDLSGMPLESILPREIADELIVLLRRSKRMGLAATEIELPGPRGRAERNRNHRPAGTGKRSRGMHPGAGRCHRFPARPAPDGMEGSSPAGGPRNQKSAHARLRFPRSESANTSTAPHRTPIRHSQMQRRHPGFGANHAQAGRPVCLAGAVPHLAAQGVRSELHCGERSGPVRRAEFSIFASSSAWAAAFPPVLADPEALKRALANLIDNAAEAMQSSLLRELTIETGTDRGTHHGGDRGCRYRPWAE